jgi:hypothetical protein
LDIARRALALIRHCDVGDPQISRRFVDFWKESLTHPVTARQLSFSKAHWDFIEAGIAEVRRREGPRAAPEA